MWSCSLPECTSLFGLSSSWYPICNDVIDPYQASSFLHLQKHFFPFYLLIGKGFPTMNKIFNSHMNLYQSFLFCVIVTFFPMTGLHLVSLPNTLAFYNVCTCSHNSSAMSQGNQRWFMKSMTLFSDFLFTSIEYLPLPCIKNKYAFPIFND